MTVEKGNAQVTGIADTLLPRPRGLRHNLRWVAIGVITVLTITNYLDRGNLSVAAPQIQDDLGINATHMGIILSAFVWPYAVMNLPTGWAVDRFGAKALMAIAVGAWSVVAVLTGFARSVWMFIVLRAGLGVSESPMFPAALKVTDAWFPDREKAAATSTYIAATQVGLALAPPIATGLMLTFGWPAMFVIMGMLGFLALAGWLVLYRQPEQHPRLTRDEYDYIKRGQVERGKTDVATTEKASAREWGRLFAFRSTWVMLVGAFCLQYVFWFYITWLPTYLQEAQDFTIEKAGIVAALPYIAGTVGVLLGGGISDKFVRRGTEPMRARRLTITAGALLTAVALVATSFSTDKIVAVTLLTIGMFTYSLSSGPYWTLAANVVRTPKLVASMGSIQNFGGFLGGACAPIVTGIVVDRFGGFGVALVVTSVLLLVSATMYGLVLRRQLPV